MEPEQELSHQELSVPRNSEQRLRTLYTSVLGRDVDPQGERVYLMQLNEGRSPESIREELIRSGEFRESMSEIAERDRGEAVTEIYHRVFGRELDEGGRDAYVTNTHLDTDGVIDELLTSGEFRDMQRDSLLTRELGNLYEEVLGRAVDSAGQSVYLDQLRNGRSLTEIRKELANSDEFKRRQTKMEEPEPEPRQQEIKEAEPLTPEELAKAIFLLRWESSVEDYPDTPHRSGFDTVKSMDTYNNLNRTLPQHGITRDNNVTAALYSRNSIFHDSEVIFRALAKMTQAKYGRVWYMLGPDQGAVLIMHDDTFENDLTTFVVGSMSTKVPDPTGRGTPDVVMFTVVKSVGDRLTRELRDANPDTLNNLLPVLYPQTTNHGKKNPLEGITYDPKLIIEAPYTGDTPPLAGTIQEKIAGKSSMEFFQMLADRARS